MGRRGQAGEALAILAGHLEPGCPPGLLLSPQIGVPLKNQEVEDIVVYLSSLGNHNSIMMDNLASTYKQWSLARQQSTLTIATEGACLPLQQSTLTTATEGACLPPPLPVQGGS